MKKAIFLAALLAVLLNGCGGGSDGSNAIYPPAIPTNLAVKECTETDVTIQWADNADNESGYIIERSVNGGEYAIINSTDPDATEYTEALADDSVHAYRLHAFNSAGDSELTGEVTIKRPKAAKSDITTEAGGSIVLAKLAAVTFPIDSFSSDESVEVIEGVMDDSIAPEKMPYLDIVSDIKVISIIDFTSKDLVLEKTVNLVMNYDPEFLTKLNEEIQTQNAGLVTDGIVKQTDIDKMKLLTSDLDIYYFNTITSKWIKTNAVIDPALNTFSVDVTYMGIYCIGYSQFDKLGFSLEADPELQQYMIDSMNDPNQNVYKAGIGSSKSADTCPNSCGSTKSGITKSVLAPNWYTSDCTRTIPLKINGVEYSKIPGTNINAKCDNCSGPAFATDALSGFAFTSACANHDGCYRYGNATYGYSKNACDNKLFAETQQSCASKYPFFVQISVWTPWKTYHPWVPTPPWYSTLRINCINWSGVTYASVRDYAGVNPFTDHTLVPYELQPCFDYYGRGVDCNIPYIKNIEADKLICEPGESVDLTSYANNPENRALTYTWSANSGTIDNASSKNIRWTAPSSIADDTHVKITLSITAGSYNVPSKTKAVTVLKPYTISYNINGADSGTAPATTVHNYYGSSNYIAGNTGNLTKTANYFAGWNTQADGNGYERIIGSHFIMGKSDITIYAKWLPTYRCLYNGNNNTSGTPPSDAVYYKPGTTVTVKDNIDLVRTGFYFAGWNTQADGNGTNISGTLIIGNSNAVVYARWLPTYTVTYNGNGQTTGDVPDDPGRYLQGANVTVRANLGTLLKTGSNFTGWNTDPDGNGNDRAVGGTFPMGSSNTILYAKWSPYPVTYSGNSNTTGSVPSDTNNYMIGENVTVKYNTGGLSRTGLTFQGWNTAANGTGTNYAEGAVFPLNVSTITLFAKWVYVSPNIGNMIYVPAGSFQRDSGPANISVISLPFRMSQNLITRAQFLAIMGTDPSNPVYTSGTSDPVQKVNWYHAIAFCNKLSIAEGLSPVYNVTGINFTTLTFASIPITTNATWDAVTATLTNTGYRLPTDMQYMWAAMGAMSDNRTADIVEGVNIGGYNKGYAGSSETAGAQLNVSNYAWTGANGVGKTHPVGTKLPNELGFYDMSGNAWEWIWDSYAAYPAGTLTDYMGAASSMYRTKRGSSFDYDKTDARISLRINTSPYTGWYDYSLRVVCP